MNRAKLKIFTDGAWKTLVLKDSSSIKYNKVVNRIGDYSTREISHSNTFSLLQIHENTTALKLNYFNHRDLAKSLNSKYLCKYYIDETLFKEGFLVINNTNNNEINVNFIDKSLTILSIWENVTFKELLLDDIFERPADYQEAIDEMKTYFLDMSAPVTSFLSEVGNRGYNLSLFPNNLNMIGDKFQVDSTGVRADNIFNPYQTRPVFNAKAVFDLACETFGYTPIFDPSVDWEDMATSYIVPEGLAKTEDKNTTEVQYAPVEVQPIKGAVRLELKEQGPLVWGVKKIYSVVTDEESNRSIKPNTSPGWVHPSNWFNDYLDEKCIFQPDFSQTQFGKIRVSVRDIDTFRGAPTNDFVFGGNVGIPVSYWENLTPGGDVVPKVIIHQEFNYSNSVMSWSIDKTELQNPPQGAGALIGVMFTYIDKPNYSTNFTTVTESVITETFVDPNVITYDDYGQFETETLDLTYAAPEKSLKDLIKGLMNQAGILLDINEENKTIKFFNYNLYVTNISQRKYSDWSKYLRKYNPFNFNTDYGDKYGANNNIGLGS